MEYRLQTPLTKDKLKGLHAGDQVLISGEIYTARDAAHGRLKELLEARKPLPIDLENLTVYYAGPTPAPPKIPVGSIGPTTAGRMDAYTPALLEQGMTAMIGKGARSPEVMEAIRRSGAVYFGCIGGAGALVARCVEKSELVAWEDLGSEAIRKLTVRNFPVTVLACGDENLYELGKSNYLASLRSQAQSKSWALLGLADSKNGTKTE